MKLLKGNKMRFKLFVILMMTSLLFIGCETKKRVKALPADHQAAAPQQNMGAAHEVVVKEAIHANSYTYLLVTEGSEEYWIATAKQPIEAGMTMYYDKGLEMKDFASKEIDRTFESIWFVGKMSGLSSASSGAMNKSMAPATNIAVEKVAGGVSVAELYENRADYEGKVVSIRGQVTKFNSKIMGRNWVHIQDGTKSGEAFDVTITTDATVEKGDVVVFNGTVGLNKDFGAGYVYDIIIEAAELSAES